MKRFKRHIHEDDCKCPEGWSVLASFQKWCICISDEPEGLDDEEDDDDSRQEGFIPARQPGKRALEFPLIRYDDLIRIRLVGDSMSIKIGESGYIPIPEDEQIHVWRIVEDRMHD